MSKMRILWVVPKWPLPAIDGARTATVSLLKQITAKQVHVDLFAFVPDNSICNVEELQEFLKVKEVFIHRISGRIIASPFRALLRFLASPMTPVTIAPYLDRKVILEVEKCFRLATEAGNPYTHVVNDCLHAGAWLLKAKIPPECKVIYRAHNVETNLWKTAAKQRGGITSVALEFQAQVINAFEKQILDKSTVTASVSDADVSELQKLSSTAKFYTIPIGADFSEKIATTNAETLTLLFLGRLDWPPNREGLLWFLNNVWPVVRARRADIKLLIAGSGEGGPIRECAHDSQTSFLGYVPDITPLYLQAHACIIPILSGSGTRVKAIEAAKFGRALVSTSLGVEGLFLKPGVEFIKADNAEEWIRSLQTLSIPQTNVFGTAAYDCCKKALDACVIGEKFYALLESSTNG